MNQEKTLKDFLEDNKGGPIDAIAEFMKNHIGKHWQSVLLDEREKLEKAYLEAGDAAYGTYLNLLLLPIHRQFKEAGLRPEPRLPGDFDISREWGNEEENNQQRWMWSTIYGSDEEPLGTIVTITHHDHTRFRIPRQPGIIALNETRKDDVVEALSLLSPDFKQALEFTIEYELYLRSQQNEDGTGAV